VIRPGGIVLVTGGAGFVGANLARALVAREFRVLVLDDLSMGRQAYLDGVPHEFVRGSLGDPHAVARAVSGVDAVVHLAARPGIPDSVADPIGTFDANVTQTVRLLDAARTAGARRFVFASSNAATGGHPPPATEDDLPHPTSPYGASKLAGEAYVQAFAATYGLPAVALRFSNIYGPYALHKSSVVATWLRAALTGTGLTIHGDGSQTRDFVHASDLARAIVAALEAPEERVAGEVFQAGTGIETTINELASQIVRAVGRDVPVTRGEARAGDVRRNVARVDKAAEVLGFRATTSLADGLGSTAAWFRDALATPALAAIRPDARSGSE
jgi:UDP-glucose 4-epimerase